MDVLFYPNTLNGGNGTLAGIQIDFNSEINLTNISLPSEFTNAGFQGLAYGTTILIYAISGSLTINNLPNIMTFTATFNSINASALTITNALASDNETNALTLIQV